VSGFDTVEIRTAVKAATLHELRVEEQGGRWSRRRSRRSRGTCSAASSRRAASSCGCASNAELAEEAPLAYKDVERVVDVVCRAGIARKVARLEPIGVLKG
jgi:tRNA-splicing ligase RtcB